MRLYFTPNGDVGSQDITAFKIYTALGNGDFDQGSFYNLPVGVTPKPKEASEMQTEPKGAIAMPGNTETKSHKTNAEKDDRQQKTRWEKYMDPDGGIALRDSENGNDFYMDPEGLALYKNKNAVGIKYKMGPVPEAGDDNAEFKYDKFRLSPNTKYRFKVATVTSYGEGACSVVLSATTLQAQHGVKYALDKNGNYLSTKMNPAGIPWIRDGHAEVSDKGEHYGLPDLPGMRDGGDKMFQPKESSEEEKK